MCLEKAADSKLSQAFETGDAASRIIALFDDLFLGSTNTCLRGGASEPLYEPPKKDKPAIVWFRENYFSSALHEVAHWCIAGDARRRQLDYGYWYAPDGRDEIEQQRFLAVEAKPQSLEWIFSQAANHSFRISLDNLNSQVDLNETRAFAHAVAKEANAYVARGLPARAALFFQGLQREFYPSGRSSSSLLTQLSFTAEALG